MREDLIDRLRNFENSDELGNGDFSLLHEAAAALEAAREDACVSLVADIRRACGDDFLRMRQELVEYIRGLAADAARYRWLRKGANRGANDDVAVVRGLGAMDYGMSAVAYTYSEEIDGDDLDAAIDDAMQRTSGGDYE